MVVMWPISNHNRTFVTVVAGDPVVAAGDPMVVAGDPVVAPSQLGGR